MQQIVLNNGTALEDSHVNLDGSTLWFYIGNGMTMADVFGLMNNPENTRVIRFVEGNEETFEGFTDLFYLRRERGQISGGLRRTE